jgi:DNA-binding NtrC family response regulator
MTQPQNENKSSAFVDGSILIVDDEPSVARSIKRSLRKINNNIKIASGGADALSILEKESFTLVISDMRMPQMSGAELLSCIATRWPDTIRVAITGGCDKSDLDEAINVGKIACHMSKPWDNEQLQLIIRSLMESGKLPKEYRPPNDMPTFG